MAAKHNPDEPHYFGKHFKTLGGYTSGGAGYVLSREALRQLEDVLANERSPDDCKTKETDGVEDALLGCYSFRFAFFLSFENFLPDHFLNCFVTKSRTFMWYYFQALTLCKIKACRRLSTLNTLMRRPFGCQEKTKIGSVFSKLSLRTIALYKENASK